MPSWFTFSYSSMRSSSALSFGPRASSSCMSMGSISASLASSMAFSAVPPTPMPSMPGGHQPAPMVGTVFSTQSTIESLGFSITNFDLFSEPPPLAATVTSTSLPGTSSTWNTAGELSFVFLRANSGSSTTDARRRLSGWSYARRTPSLIISARLRLVSQRTSMPTLRNMLTMPVSWQIGRLPSAHMRELVRICAMASLAAGFCSRS